MMRRRLESSIRRSFPAGAGASGSGAEGRSGSAGGRGAATGSGGAGSETAAAAAGSGRTSGGAGPGAERAEESAGDRVGAPPMAASISFFTTRPPGPVPCRAARSSPLASAILRARGEALIRSAPVVGGGTGAGTDRDSPDPSSAAATGAGMSVVSGLSSASPSPSPAVSSPSSRKMARVAPIAAVPPSSTRISERIPSSNASIAMVALSVSISAISSPISTSSPTCLSHLTTVPSVMVSESFGISILIAMESRGVAGCGRGRDLAEL